MNVVVDHSISLPFVKSNIIPKPRMFTGMAEVFADYFIMTGYNKHFMDLLNINQSFNVKAVQWQ